MGDGDVAVGMVRAVEAGVIDIAFSCWTLLKGEVLVVRDNDGAIRYLEHGNIPLPKEVMEYHQERIAQSDKGDIDMVIDSIFYCSRPLGKETSWLR
jgi:methylaspartate mutase epsilon subunit